MLCSEKELNIGQDNDGIMILPKDTELGISLDKYLGLDDMVFELEITLIDLIVYLILIGIAKCCILQ